MKRINHFAAAGLFCCLFLVTSGCKTEPKAEEPPIPAANFKFAMIKHPVKDYNSWKAVYMANDSLRDAYGISKFVIGRGTDDTTITFVVEKISDVQKVRDFGASPDLKAAMDSAGVTGPPVIALAEMIRLDTTTNTQLNRVIVSHRVKDFDAWLKVYDSEGRATRAASGLADRALARDLDDPNMVYVSFAITDREKANARMQSEELKKLMTDAGVEGPPSFFFFTADPSN
jgi:quinol monooxygenase YgiN